jgi:hypothetical protein
MPGIREKYITTPDEKNQTYFSQASSVQRRIIKYIRANSAASGTIFHAECRNPEGEDVTRVCAIILVISVLNILPAIGREAEKCASPHTGPVAVFIDPTDEEIAAMKKEYGEEDFDTVADDAMYYSWQATEFLNGLNIPTCSTKDESHLFVTKDGREYRMDRACDGWCLILWNGKEEPVYADMAEIFTYEPYLKRKQ